MQILIQSDGTLRCVYDETISLSALGHVSIRRGSYVEPTEAGWTADLAPVEGPLLGPFPRRSQALLAEQHWLHQHWL